MDQRILNQISQLERGTGSVRLSSSKLSHNNTDYGTPVLDQQSPDYRVHSQGHYSDHAYSKMVERPIFTTLHDDQLDARNEYRHSRDHIESDAPRFFWPDGYLASRTLPHANCRDSGALSQPNYWPNQPTYSPVAYDRAQPPYITPVVFNTHSVGNFAHEEALSLTAEELYHSSDGLPVDPLDDELLQPLPSIVYNPSPPMITQNHPRPLLSFQSPPTEGPKTPNLGPPIVQGIQLAPRSQLPVQFQTVFPFPLFNAVQSKSFGTIYNTNDNFVLSAPTGSGKTAVLELAICRLINGFESGTFKIIYQAPTKSLCSERQRDWQSKFGPLGLQCEELTGDTGSTQLRNVQHAGIIVTTPEKWDGITRKWKDHQRLMQMVKLFLIDEVHMLKEDRGATLEAVVSRMKSVGSNVRFIALSATVPNSHDIAAWLGKDCSSPDIPAQRETFGEDFRPVKVQKYVCGYQSKSNDFAFEKMLNTKLPEVIGRWSQRKPIMIFCFTRNSCVETAKLLAKWWSEKDSSQRYWEAPRKQLGLGERDLRETTASGVAFHHAGLAPQDRAAIEKGYIDGDINVICCTSTLAVGVNLPCHMAIIKNTVSYQGASSGGCKEYSDLEIMQMIGRAGRPQYDKTAIAVIMTRQQRVSHFEKMITSQEVLESCLHRNLIDHINAEIGLGTIADAYSAKKWLAGTFLYVRLKDHPEHYRIDGDVPNSNIDEQLHQYCKKAVELLEDADLVRNTSNKIRCTEFGDIMARYCVQFETMKRFMCLPPGSKVSEILSVISQAAEFKDVRFRSGEKSLYKTLNQNPLIKFPIPVNLDIPAHKTSLIIQSVLGAIELPAEGYKHRPDFNICKTTIFQHVNRLIRCIIDSQLCRGDSVSVRNALMLARSLGAGVWDDSPLHIIQLDGIGSISVRKLVSANIRSFEDIDSVEPYQIESALSRNPPFGTRLQETARKFPKLWVSLKAISEPVVKKRDGLDVKIKAEIGFVNDQPPLTWQRKSIYVCFLAETTDGRLAHFARTSAKKLQRSQDLLFTVNLTRQTQSVRGYVMCDEIAGTMRTSILKPELSRDALSHLKTLQVQNSPPTQTASNCHEDSTITNKNSHVDPGDDEFYLPDIDEADLATVDSFSIVDLTESRDDSRQEANESIKGSQQSGGPAAAESRETFAEPQQLGNGRWACNHFCKAKTACKHLCCRDGLDKKPKPRKVKEAKFKAALDPKQLSRKVSEAKVQQKSIVSTTSTQGPLFVPNPRLTPTTASSPDSRDKGTESPTSSNPGFRNAGTGMTRLGKPFCAKRPSASNFVKAARQAEDESFLPSEHHQDGPGAGDSHLADADWRQWSLVSSSDPESIHGMELLQDEDMPAISPPNVPGDDSVDGRGSRGDGGTPDRASGTLVGGSSSDSGSPFARPPTRADTHSPPKRKRDAHESCADGSPIGPRTRHAFPPRSLAQLPGPHLHLRGHAPPVKRARPVRDSALDQTAPSEIGSGGTSTPGATTTESDTAVSETERWFNATFGTQLFNFVK